MLSLLGATGCQVQVGGQTLPSPYYLTDDVQYFAPGPEFKLAKEAAAQKAFANSQAAANAPNAPGAVGQPVPAPPQPQPPPNAGARAGQASAGPMSGISGPGFSYSNDGVYTTGN
jgi:hypothetical protein